MDFFSLWSRGDIIEFAALIAGVISAIAAVIVIPEVRRFLRLDNPRSKSDRRRRKSLLFVFAIIGALAGVLVWLWIEPKFVKWKVIAAMDEEAPAVEVVSAAAPDPSPGKLDSVLGPPLPEIPRGPEPSPVPELEEKLGYLPETVTEIIEGSRADENLGGGNVVLDMWSIERLEDVSASQIDALFVPIVSPDALSNLAIGGRVRIHEVRLRTIQRRFVVTLRVENTTYSEVKAEIPKGQVFENKQPKRKVQNLAAKGESPAIVIPPRGTVEVKVDALCINQKWSPPNGGEGNVTIFKIKEQNFSGQEDLWAKIDSAIREYKSTQEAR